MQSFEFIILNNILGIKDCTEIELGLLFLITFINQLSVNLINSLLSSRLLPCPCTGFPTLQTIQNSVCLQVTNPRKVGDGMSSYVVYTVTSKTNMTLFKRPGTVRTQV